MQDQQRFNEAIRRIDDANQQDPRMESIGGTPVPRELLFAERVYGWIPRLIDDPSEVLLLAARSHTIGRWKIPRDNYPKNNAGYHEWRDALARFHGDQAADILRDVGYDDEAVDNVRALITRANWPRDAEAQALEDADCLVFLETKLHNYLDEWDEQKAVNILRKTLRKMTPRARKLADQLKLDSRCTNLIRLASK